MTLVRDGPLVHTCAYQGPQPVVGEGEGEAEGWVRAKGCGWGSWQCGSNRGRWTLVRSGLLRARAHQRRGVRRRYGVLCEVVVRGVGRNAQDVVAVPGGRDRGPSTGLPSERVRAGRSFAESRRPVVGHGGGLAAARSSRGCRPGGDGGAGGCGADHTATKSPWGVIGWRGRSCRTSPRRPMSGGSPRRRSGRGKCPPRSHSNEWCRVTPAPEAEFNLGLERATASAEVAKQATLGSIGHRWHPLARVIFL